jgi:hypothetical protein
MGVEGSEELAEPPLKGVSGTKRLALLFGAILGGKAFLVGVGVCIASRFGKAGKKDAVRVS